MPKVEFKKTAKPNNEAELLDYIEDTRNALTIGGEATDEALKKVEADLKVGFEAKQESERTAKRVKELEESIKTLHEQGRIHGDDSIERQLKSLPMLHRVEKDEDYAGKVPATFFNLLTLSRKELELYLDGPALSWAKRFRRLNNMALTAHHIVSILSETSPAKREAYAAAGGIKGSELWAPLQEAWKQGQRALSTGGSTTGSEWVPTIFSADKWDDVRDMLEVANIFRWLPMPQSPWNIPTLLGFLKAYIIPEANNNTAGSNTPFTASDITTANRTLTAKKFATISYFSPEEEQDSIIPILPMFDEEVNYAQAFGVDDAVVNGQLTATIDTGAVPGSTDVKANVDGIRYNASLTNVQIDMSAGMSPERLAQMIQGMGKYANPRDCNFLTGYAGLAKALVLKDGNGNLVYLTREHAGDAATMFTGSVGVLMGYPLTIGGVVPQNMNGAGIIDGVGGSIKTAIYLCNTRPWLGGVRAGLQVEVDRSERFSYDQVGIRSKQRLAFRSLVAASATRPFVVSGVGL
jgi:HK97 family phage major capsid protein